MRAKTESVNLDEALAELENLLSESSEIVDSDHDSLFDLEEELARLNPPIHHTPRHMGNPFITRSRSTSPIPASTPYNPPRSFSVEYPFFEDFLPPPPSDYPSPFTAPAFTSSLYPAHHHRGLGAGYPPNPGMPYMQQPFYPPYPYAPYAAPAVIPAPDPDPRLPAENPPAPNNAAEHYYMNRLNKKEQKHKDKQDSRKESGHHRGAASHTVGAASGTVTRGAFHYAPVLGGTAGGAAIGGVIGSGIVPPVTTFLGIAIGGAIGGAGGKFVGDIGDAVLGGLVEKSTSWLTSHAVDAPRKLLMRGLAKYSGKHADDAAKAKVAVAELQEHYGNDGLRNLGATQHMLDQQKETLRAFETLDKHRFSFKRAVERDMQLTARQFNDYFPAGEAPANNLELNSADNLHALASLLANPVENEDRSLVSSAYRMQQSEQRFNEKYAALDTAYRPTVDAVKTACEGRHNMPQHIRQQPLDDQLKELKKESHAARLLQEQAKNNKSPIYAAFS